MKLLQISEPNQSPHPPRFAVGIDFGTTNSLIAFSQNLAPKILTYNDKRLLPSRVNFMPNGAINVGDFTISEGASIITSIKRLMGKSYEEALTLTNRYMLINENGVAKISIGTKNYSAIEIAAEIFKKLRYIAENALAKEVTEAVITVPAYFDEAARSATKEAAQLAGFSVLRLLNEPTAAALAYGLDHAKDGIYLVYDLGGGTFDVSILEISKHVVQVLATGGHNTLGGDDFDRCIEQYFSIQVGAPLSVSDSYRLVRISKQAKEHLSSHSFFQTTLDLSATEVTLHITQEKFEELIFKLIKQTLSIVEETLLMANITSNQIEGIILVGGSTRIPLIYKSLKDKFNVPILNNHDPDEIVALGAAIQAENLTKDSEYLLLDVTPLSLGLVTMGGIVEKLIPRNTAIPISVSQEFTTSVDGQAGMTFHIVQGERELAEDCRSLAYFELENLPPTKAGILRIKVTFTLDSDGLLTVSAVENQTGESQIIKVTPSSGLTEDEIIRLLKEAMVYNQQDMSERLLRETIITAQHTIDEIRRALHEDADLLSETEIKALQQQIILLETTLEEKDKNLIEDETIKLNELGEKLAEQRIQRYFGSALKGKTLAALRQIID